MGGISGDHDVIDSHFLCQGQESFGASTPVIQKHVPTFRPHDPNRPEERLTVFFGGNTGTKENNMALLGNTYPFLDS